MLCFSASGVGQGTPPGVLPTASLRQGWVDGMLALPLALSLHDKAQAHPSLLLALLSQLSLSWGLGTWPGQGGWGQCKTQHWHRLPWSSQRDLCFQAHFRHLALIFHTYHRLMFCLYRLLGKVWVHSAPVIGVLGCLPSYFSTICFQNPLELRCTMGKGWNGGRK